MVRSLQLTLTDGDAKSRGNFFAGGFSRLGNGLLLGEGRLRNTHLFGHFILRKPFSFLEPERYIEQTLEAFSARNQCCVELEIDKSQSQKLLAVLESVWKAL